MALPARFQRARHPLGARRVLLPAPRPSPVLAPLRPVPTPEAALEAMRLGAELAGMLRRQLASERRAALHAAAIQRAQRAAVRVFLRPFYAGTTTTGVTYACTA